MMSFAVTPGGRRPSTLTAKLFGSRWQQALRGQHVPDLAGADAEGQRAERAVGAGVAVAADDGHARLGEPELRADDVDDALALVAERRAGSPTSRSSLQRPELRRAPPGRRPDTAVRSARGGRRRVVHGGHGAVRPAHLEAALQLGERLGRRDLVDQVQVDVEDVRRARRARPHEV